MLNTIQFFVYGNLCGLNLSQFSIDLDYLLTLVGLTTEQKRNVVALAADYLNKGGNSSAYPAKLRSMKVKLRGKFADNWF